MTDSSVVKNPLALIIEDNEAVSEIMQTAVAWAGFEVELIRDGRSALDRLATITPALVLLDLHLPRVSGDEVLRFIRSETRLAKTRVIIATADLIRAERLEGEADFVLVKPFGFTQLHDLAKQIRSSLSEC
ncbi:MAG: response regulator [Chloroflexi bacterium]|nr:response regulator [Chloroflexota bacterium]